MFGMLVKRMVCILLIHCISMTIRILTKTAKSLGRDVVYIGVIPVREQLRSSTEVTCQNRRDTGNL